MNIIDLFKELGYYDNNPQIDAFTLVVIDKYGYTPDLYHNIYIKGGVVWHSENELSSNSMRSSGIFFYMDINNPQVQRNLEWRMEHPGHRFNNYWPKHGETGVIDMHGSIKSIFENFGKAEVY